MKNGCYYGYIISKADRVIVQELPTRYCRSRFISAEGIAVVEFNMSYFDKEFSTAEQRNYILKILPPEFEKGYKAYKQKKADKKFPLEEGNGWYLLPIGAAFKFNLNG